MFYVRLLLILGLLLPAVAVAQEAQEGTFSPKVLNANFRRIGLDLSSTEVRHAQQYANSPVSQLNADSQTVVKGVFDFVLEYETNSFRWDNSAFAEYAKTKLKPADQPADTNESADKILFSTNYTQKIWDFEDGSIGPFVDGSYQTEFTKNKDPITNQSLPRTKILRGKAGLKLFDGIVFKDLYIAGVGEYDMTYNPDASKTAGETGFRIEKDIKEGVKFSSDGYYRRYFSASHKNPEDLRYDMNITARMDVNLYSSLTVGPYISYRRARSRSADVAGSNFMIGLSFSYIDLFNLINKKGE
ncbi:MAG: DUF3078 domain-containing protein [Alphaproteobacteria bacterium]|nr:DUF3078 domain-containing protein [Alphaproteobacteria bacterium]